MCQSKICTLTNTIFFIVNHQSGNLSQSIIKISEVIQKHIEDLVLNDDSENYNQIADSFLKCLELLYNNLPENDSNTSDVSS